MGGDEAETAPLAPFCLETTSEPLFPFNMDSDFAGRNGCNPSPRPLPFGKGEGVAGDVRLAFGSAMVARYLWSTLVAVRLGFVGAFDGYADVSGLIFSEGG